MIETLFNGITIVDFVAFYLLALFGLFLSMALEVYKLHKKIEDFELKIWFDINQYRLLLNLVFIVLGIIFTEELTGSIVTPFTAFLAGFSVDKVIESFKDKK